MKSLFIPLKKQYFLAFEDKSKKVERRLYGKRWNENTCPIGRSVVLSLGYGKKRRLNGVVTGFRKVKMMDSEGCKDLLECYGVSKFNEWVAEIEIEATNEHSNV